MIGSPDSEPMVSSGVLEPMTHRQICFFHCLIGILPDDEKFVNGDCRLLTRSVNGRWSLVDGTEHVSGSQESVASTLIPTSNVQRPTSNVPQPSTRFRPSLITARGSRRRSAVRAVRRES